VVSVALAAVLLKNFPAVFGTGGGKGNTIFGILNPQIIFGVAAL
jgi:hypothetical protein